jgi:hypothetical protein
MQLDGHVTGQCYLVNSLPVKLQRRSQRGIPMTINKPPDHCQIISVHMQRQGRLYPYHCSGWWMPTSHSVESGTIQANLCGICGVKTGSGIDFSPRISGFSASILLTKLRKHLIIPMLNKPSN